MNAHDHVMIKHCFRNELYEFGIMKKIFSVACSKQEHQQACRVIQSSVGTDENYLKFPQSVVTLILPGCLLGTQRDQLVNALRHCSEYTRADAQALNIQHFPSACTQTHIHTQFITHTFFRTSLPETIEHTAQTR